MNQSHVKWMTALAGIALLALGGRADETKPRLDPGSAPDVQMSSSSARLGR